jgi:hypothetical protein
MQYKKSGVYCADIRWRIIFSAPYRVLFVFFVGKYATRNPVEKR